MNYESEIFIPSDGETVDKSDEIVVNLRKPVPFAGLPHTDQLSLLSAILTDTAFDGHEMLYNNSFEINLLLRDMIIEKITAEEFKKSLINGLKSENGKMFTQLIEKRFKEMNEDYLDGDDLELPSANDPAYSERRCIERW